MKHYAIKKDLRKMKREMLDEDIKQDKKMMMKKKKTKKKNPY